MLPVDEIRLNFNPHRSWRSTWCWAFSCSALHFDTRVADFRRVLRMPGAMAVGVAAQFIVLPAVTFVLTLLLKPGPSIALGMIQVACCPPGNVSNILTHRAGGNVALSVSMTAISNALAIVLMPLNFAFWGGLHPTAAPLLRSIALDPLEMAGHESATQPAPAPAGRRTPSAHPSRPLALTRRANRHQTTAGGVQRQQHGQPDHIVHEILPSEIDTGTLGRAA